MIFTYTARRSIISGHTLNTSYAYFFDTIMHRADFLIKRIGKQEKSISGNTQYQLDRLEEYIDIETVPVSEVVMESILEFLHSVSAGESFTMDRFGTLTTPDNVVSVILDGDFKISVVDQVPHYKVSFKVYLN